MVVSSLLILLAGAIFSLPLPQPFVDTICVPKPSIGCDFETSNRMPHEGRVGKLVSEDTSVECPYFRIWKLGQRQERRRIYAILRRELKELTLQGRSEPDHLLRANRAK
jgi:hypothetical protein